MLLSLTCGFPNSIRQKGEITGNVHMTEGCYSSDV